MIKIKSEKNRGARIVNRKMKEIFNEMRKPKPDPMFWHNRGFVVTYEEMFGEEI